jgi:hypothetical protein
VCGIDFRGLRLFRPISKIKKGNLRIVIDPGFPFLRFKGFNRFINSLTSKKELKKMKHFLVAILSVATVFAAASPLSAKTVDLEDLTLEPESYWNGSDGSGGFESRGVMFNNNYNAEWGSWDGFAYSNRTDTTLEGFDAQYNAIPGVGAQGSDIYAVAYVSTFAETPPTITFSEGRRLDGVYVTNSNYTYYSMRDGDAFAKKFTADDELVLTIRGINEAGQVMGTIEFKLADGRNIVKDWRRLDLSGLGTVKKITFSLSSTDVGEYGMNTPAYFCLDHIAFQDDDEYFDDDDSSCFINAIR